MIQLNNKSSDFQKAADSVQLCDLQGTADVCFGENSLMFVGSLSGQ